MCIIYTHTCVCLDLIHTILKLHKNDQGARICTFKDLVFHYLDMMLRITWPTATKEFVGSF